jgi:hypothetical protein
MSKRVLLLIMCSLAIALGTAGSSAAATRKCSHKGNEVIRTAQVIVRGRGSPPRFFVCRRSTGREREIADDAGVSGSTIWSSVFHLTASGLFVVWEQRGYTINEASTAVYRYDARSGRTRIYNGTTDEVDHIDDPRAPHQVDLLTVTASGLMAWSADNQRANPPRPEVFAVDASGRRLLDFGPKINRSSVVIQGNAVRWSNGEAQRSEPLTPAR